MTIPSATDLLVLHAVRIKGMADDAQVAARYGLEESQVAELLLDFEANGWISKHSFGAVGGWSLTAAGKARNEQQLAAELAIARANETITEVYVSFLPSNEQLQRASTHWQLRPSPHDPLAANLHDDPVWDATVVDDLIEIDRALGGMEVRLVGVLVRFAGYKARFGAALGRVRAGENDWVTGVGNDSCHTVWMELHEDLLATLGLQRTSST